MGQSRSFARLPNVLSHFTTQLTAVVLSPPPEETKEILVTVKVSEGAAYGAALQALWCWRLQRGERVKISDITGQFVLLNKPESARPSKAGVQTYREWQSIQDELSLALRPAFLRHHRFVSGRAVKK